MPDASYVQSSFLGGEWSPYFQGRFDHPKYRTAMKLCRNALPIEEGACVRRTGSNFRATTRNGAPGRVISFDIEQVNPFQIELTDGHMRLFAGRSLIFDSVEVVTAITTATPAKITFAKPVTWNTGDQIQLLFQGAATSASAAILRNRQLALTKIDSQNFTIADPVTGLGVPGNTINWDPTQVALTGARVLDFVTTYTNKLWQNVRRVQNENTAVLLTNSVAPQVLALPQNGSSNQFAPFQFSALNFVDGPYLDPVQGSQATPGGTTGIITLIIGWQGWVITTTYGLGDIVTYNGLDYQSNVAGNVGNTPGVAAQWTKINAGSAVGNQGFMNTDIGRMIRLFSEPPVWNPSQVYGTVGTSVTYNGLYYTSIAAMSSANKVPTNSVNQWAVNPEAAQWTWGKITAVNGPNQVSLQILGVPLLYSGVVNTWRLGAYSNTTGWPTCGTFHEGRLWLGGAIPNRFDASMSNGDEFLPGVTNTWQFAPTQLDGTVADNNAITYTFRAPDKNTILWMEPDHQGIVCGTLKAEWLIQASQQNDPLTPTSIQAHRITKYGCANIEPKRTGLTLTFVQAYQRKVMEFFPDVFTGKFTAPNLTETSKHLTVSGIQEIGYQRELAPVVWARTANGSLLGCTYKRETLMSSQPANFVGWHKHSLGSGRLVESISVGPTPDGTSDEVVMVTNDPNTNIRHVEALTPLFDQGALLTTAWYLDDAVTPSGSSTANNAVTFYGLWHLNGQTVTVFAGGLYLGQFVVANGAVTCPFAPAGINPNFTQAYLNSISAATYGAFATSIDSSVTVKPPVPIVGASSNGVILGYVGSPLSITDLSQSRALPDWNNGLLYIHESQAGGSSPSPWRKFNLVGGNEVAEYLSVSGDANAPTTIGFDGNVYTMDNGNANFLYKINPTGFTLTATFGTTPDGFGDFGDQSGVVPQANSLTPISALANYLLAVGGINDTATVLNTDTMQFAGHLFTFPTSVNRTGRFSCRGVSTTDGNGNYLGTAFIAWNSNNPTNAINLYRTSVKRNMQLAYGPNGGGLFGLFGSASATTPYPIGADTYGTPLTWDAAIQYQTGDVVLSANNAGIGGQAYFVAVQPSKGAIPIVLPSYTSTNYKNAAFWQPMGPTQGGPSPSPSGVFPNWNVATTYAVDDVVLSRGVPTRSQGASTGVDPNRGILTPSWVFMANPYINTALVSAITPTMIDPTWSTLNFGGMVFDQVDNNLIMHINTTDSVAQKAYIAKISGADGSVMWTQPVNATTLDQVSIAQGRLTTGIYAFLSDPAAGGLRNVYVFNSITGAPIQVLTIAGVAPGAGQFMDNLGGLIYVIASYTQAGGTPAPYLLTPSTYTNKWSAFWPASSGGNNILQGSITSNQRDTVPVIIGFQFTTQCQLLRPNEQREAGAANGPAFGKVRRSHQYAMLLDGTGVDNGTGIGSDLQVGTDFTHLRPVDFRNVAEQQPLVTALFSDIAWTTLDDSYSFNSELCWQITRPFPANVMAYGAFLNTQDR